MRVTSLAARLAGEAYDAFERGTRSDGETFIMLRDGAPEWVRDAVYEAHSGMLPDDWRYEQARAAFGAVHDASDYADMQEVGDQFADDATDVYSADRLAWLASSLNRPSYCDDAVSEGLVNDDADILDRIGMGQYMEAREIFAAVLSALEDACERAEEDDDAESDG